MDTVDKATRSRMMSLIPAKNTKPELIVRKIAHGLGYRYRLHRRDLDGSPDLVFPKLQKVVFVHGCYWHRHPGCQYAYSPKTNVAFWNAKFTSNTLRDTMVEERLRARGWDPLVIWECESTNKDAVTALLLAHLGS